MPQRAVVAGPRRGSLALAHLPPLIPMAGIAAAVEGPGLALRALPLFAAVLAAALAFNLWYWGFNTLEADERGLHEVIRGRVRRTVAWDDITDASFDAGSYLLGMAGSLSAGVLLGTTLPTPPRMYSMDGEITLGRLQPALFFERDAVTDQATAVLRSFLGDRVVDDR